MKYQNTLDPVIDNLIDRVRSLEHVLFTRVKELELKLANKDGIQQRDVKTRLKYCPLCGSGSINTWGTHRIELYCCDCHRKQVISA